MLKLVAVCLLASCSSPPPAEHPGSRGPRAADHITSAHDHDQAARQLEAWPDRRADSWDDPTLTARWSRSWDTAQEHKHQAAVHRSEAGQLTASYQEACGTTPAANVMISPVQRYGRGGAPIADGVLVFMSPYAGTPDQLISELRCHRAWMMLGRSQMDDCPLDVPGINLRAWGDEGGTTLEITVDDRSLVPELQRRTALDLEGAKQYGDRGHE